QSAKLHKSSVIKTASDASPVKPSVKEVPVKGVTAAKDEGQLTSSVTEQPKVDESDSKPKTDATNVNEPIDETVKPEVQQEAITEKPPIAEKQAGQPQDASPQPPTEAPVNQPQQNNWPDRVQTFLIVAFALM